MLYMIFEVVKLFVIVVVFGMVFVIDEEINWFVQLQQYIVDVVIVDWFGVVYMFVVFVWFLDILVVIFGLYLFVVLKVQVSVCFGIIVDVS